MLTKREIEKAKRQQLKEDLDRKEALSELSEVYVSEADLKSDLCKGVIQLAVKTNVMPEQFTVRDILYHVWGLNIYLDSDDGNNFEVQECQHRSRLGDLVNGKRYSGFERYDKKWLQNRMCSNLMKSEARKYDSKS